MFWVALSIVFILIGLLSIALVYDSYTRPITHKIGSEIETVVYGIGMILGVIGIFLLLSSATDVAKYNNFESDYRAYIEEHYFSNSEENDNSTMSYEKIRKLNYQLAQYKSRRKSNGYVFSMVPDRVLMLQPIKKNE